MQLKTCHIALSSQFNQMASPGTRFLNYLRGCTHWINNTIETLHPEFIHLNYHQMEIPTSRKVSCDILSDTVRGRVKLDLTRKYIEYRPQLE